MNDLIETFREVIEAGIYPQVPYMCNALDVAWRRGTITEEEIYLATAAIEAYIAPAEVVTMVHAVNQYTSPGSPPPWAEVWAATHGVAFYMNWDNRPAIANVDGYDDADS